MSDNTQQIVEEVKNELAEERFIGGKVLVSRRELVGLAAGSATVAGLLGHESGTASAQSGSGTGRLGDPTPLEYVGTDSLDTEEVNNRKEINAGTSDVGAAVNQAISELAADVGGKIILPDGQLPQSTQIDLSQGVNNQGATTPITIEGQGRPDNNLGTGTSIDASSMSSHPIYQGNSTGSHRRNIVLRDFSIINCPDSYDPFHFGDGQPFDHCRFENLGAISGGRYGFWLNDAFSGVVLDGLYARGCVQGHRIIEPNATEIRMLTARHCSSDSSPAVEIGNANAADIGAVYIESNDGPALSVYGTTAGSTIGPIYLENNNRGGTATNEVVIGDGAFSTGYVVSASIEGVRFFSPANTFSGDRLKLDYANRVGVKNIRGNPILSCTSNTQSGMVYERNFLQDVDTTAASGGGTWIENYISSAPSKNSGATTVSGD